MILRATIKGIVAAAVILTVYFLVLGLLSGLPYAWGEFVSFWYFIIALAAGFGLQVGLFFYLRDYIRSGQSSGKVLAVSGTASTSAMLSCCAHYVVNLVPFLGVAGLVTLVSQYQFHLFWVGLLFNALGIAYISWQIISVRASHTPEARQIKIKRRYMATVFLVMLVLAVSGVRLILAGPEQVDDDADTSQVPEFNLEEQVNTDGEVTVQVTPERLTDEIWVFEVSLDTHAVELDDYLDNSVVLQDEFGGEYLPLRWDGDPPGGHHRSGTLEFEPITPQPSVVSIYVYDVGGVERREFQWQLN